MWIGKLSMQRNSVSGAMVVDAWQLYYLMIKNEKFFQRSEQVVCVYNNGMRQCKDRLWIVNVYSRARACVYACACAYVRIVIIMHHFIIYPRYQNAFSSQNIISLSRLFIAIKVEREKRNICIWKKSAVNHWRCSFGFCLHRKWSAKTLCVHR